MKIERATAILAVLALSISAGGEPAVAQSRNPYRVKRHAMVREYIEHEGISDPKVLEAMRTVPRHEFVRPIDRPKAYLDGAWPIGYKQTISPPFIVAYMTESLDPQPGDRVLEIGTGSGYQAAVLAEIVKEVYTIEIVEPLGEQATQRLKKLGYDNVQVKVGDGYKGWPEHAPFDKIIVTCSPEDVPQPLIEQLKDGGRMIIPLGERYQQVFHLFEKKDGMLVKKRLISTLFVPMTGISEDRREIKPDPANPQIVNGSFELDENEDGRIDGWHYQRQLSIGTEHAPDGRQYAVFQNSEPGRPAQMLQGLAVDGTKVASLQVSVMTKYDNTTEGLEAWEQPALVVHFYDSVRRPIARIGVVGPWLGTSDWKRRTADIPVPPNAEEAIVRIGLLGATGTLCVDDVQLTPTKR